jgi:hypothetical protein
MANTKHLSASNRGSKQQSNDGRYSILYSDQLDEVSEYEIELLMCSIEQLQKLMSAFSDGAETDNETLN